MIPALLLTLVPSATVLPGTAAVPSEHAAADDKAEYDRQRKLAGKDVEKLWELHKWCLERGMDKESRSCLREILKHEPDHELANVALGNIKHDGKWFPSQKKVDEYIKEQEAKKQAADGLVDYKGKRVPPEDVPFLEKGMVRDESGRWVDGETFEKLQQGWIRQDLDWVPPEEKENVEKGLWKCGEQWLSLAEANPYHADVLTWWRIPTEKYTLYTTCDREVATEKIRKNLDRAWEDLARIYGTEPKQAVPVIVLRNTGQYGRYAAGDEEAGMPQVEVRALSSIHYAFFAEAAYDPVSGGGLESGVTYWDAADPNGERWGIHAVRNALGLSFAEGLDPSPKALEKSRKAGRFDAEAFYAEKRLPDWIRFGAASYAERYFVDTLVERGGNALWARQWAIDNIVRRGGLRSLKQILEFDISFEGGDDSAKMISEAGLLIAFAVDGKCAPVTERLDAVRAKLKEGADRKQLGKAIQELGDAIVEHEAELRKFANL